MALSNRINFRGGQSQPLGKYLYKEGVDNVALTGGLTTNGYSFSGSWTISGNVDFQNEAVSMIVSANGAYAILFGTSFPVDVTNLSGIVVKYEVSGITHTLTLDLRNVSGSYYVAICEYCPYNTNGVLGISLKNTKSLVWDSPTAKSNTSEQNRQVYIKEIQLIQS